MNSGYILSGSTIATGESIVQAKMLYENSGSHIEVSPYTVYRVPKTDTTSEIIVSITGLILPASGKVWVGCHPYRGFVPIADFIINDKHTITTGAVNNTLSTRKLMLQYHEQVLVVLESGAVEVAVVGNEKST